LGAVPVLPSLLFQPVDRVCVAAAAPTVTTDIPANATPTFGIFVTGTATVADMAGINRIFVTFTDRSAFSGRDEGRF
jgi:hypothetical protein